MEIDIPVAPKNFTLSTPISSAAAKPGIDREKRLLTGVLVARVGEAKGWGYSIEASFLADALKHIKTKKNGRVQSNMGHRYDANFFQLGRLDNFRLVEGGNALVADQTIYEAADKSPGATGMAEWYMDMAAEDSQAVMLSMNGDAAGFYQYDQKGNKVYIQYSQWSGPIKQFKEKAAFAEFKDITSVDVIDNGALTDNLFSFSDKTLPEQFKQMLSTPGFMEFFKENEDSFPELDKHFAHKYKFSLPKLLANLFSNHTTEMEDQKIVSPAAPITAAAEASTEATPGTDITAAIQAALKPLQDKLANFETQLAEKNAEIETLKKAPAATPTGVKVEAASRTDAPEAKTYMSDPITLMAKSFQTKKTA